MRKGNEHRKGRKSLEENKQGRVNTVVKELKAVIFVKSGWGGQS